MTIKTNIRKVGIPTLLKRIVAGNDSGYGYIYNNTITAVKYGDPPLNVESMREFPFINIHIGDENCSNSDTGNSLQTGGNRQLWHNSFEVMFDCFLKAEDEATAQDNMLADLQATFGTDYTIANTVFSCAYKSSTPFGLALQMPNCGISVSFIVWYRIYQTNPNISG